MKTILILDYGSQFTQLIARTVRELHVYCEIHPPTRSAEKIAALSPCGIILSGGPESVLAKGAPQIAPEVLSSAIPVLGVCYGMQALTVALNGTVESSAKQEYGHAEISLTETPSFLAGLPSDFSVWMSHGDSVVTLPPGFTVAATSGSSPIAAMADEKRKLYGLQFHPEVAHTHCGREILSRFVHDICDAGKEWTMPDFIQRACANITQKTEDEGVLLGLSGGVDSAVAAALLHRAIGGRLHCVLVDHGLMRAGEAEEVSEVFQNHFGINLTTIDASDKFFAELQGITDPEQKRHCIGRLFVEEFEAQAKQFGEEVKWLAQGTIYPDVVESAGVAEGGKAVIKSHHNVGGLPDKLNLKLLEPLRELFKDEVRELGLSLGLPATLINRHPFPGPGLAVRVLGEVSRSRVIVARAADEIFMQELTAAGLDAKTAQAFAVLLPVRTVGVMGDGRTYQNVIALRAVTTNDFMTADWARLPDDFLAKVSSRISNEVEGVNRVVYDISSKPPATVEWE